MTAGVDTPAGLSADTTRALARLLLAMADDELVIGWFDSEWTGIAPLLEEDVAMSSLAQDEIGHARALYGLRGELAGEDPDALAFDRDPADYTHARLLERRGPGEGDPEPLDWAYTIVRRWLYDTADAVRLDALAGSAYRPLAALAVKLRREETYHLAHADVWLGRLATPVAGVDEAGDEARRRLDAAFGLLWPLAGTVLAPFEGEQALLDAGLLPCSMTALRIRWVAAVHPRLVQLGLLPAGEAGDVGGFAPEAEAAPRSRPPGGADEHGFRWLWGQMTQVRRAEPGAVW
jgi:ring-1,2-phenylacetyl-CoA epoxidase subunit PaaC